VLSRVAAGRGILTPVGQLMNGVGAMWPAAAKLSLPGPDADWRAWLAWTSATSPEYQRIASSMSRGTQTELRFEESHVTAIRFYQQRTGRDVVGELRRNLAAATDDSARLVYGAILTGLGDVPTVEQVAARFRSGSAAQIALATRQLYGLFRQRAPLADSATTVAILDRLIAATIDAVAPWPNLTPPPNLGPLPPRPPRVASPRPAIYVLADSVPAVLQARWRDRVRFISGAEWQRLPEREAATLLTLSSVERIGPFVRVRTSAVGRMARQPNETPRLYASGSGYYLIATADGWAIIMQEMWVT